MPAPSNPLWTSGPGGTGYRRFRYGNADMRASDAERTEVADRLSKHYQDGRLDQAEFNERLDRAMNAKTRADFNGLFADLPDLPDETVQDSQPGKQGKTRQSGCTPARAQYRPQHQTWIGQGIYIAIFVAIAIVIAHSIAHLWWLGILVLGFLLLRYDRRRRY